MPCDSSYMEPTIAEQQCRSAANLLIWAYEKTEIHVPEWLKAVANDPYGRGGEHAMRDLCTLLRGLEKSSPSTFERIVYDGRSPDSRKLADWWEEHQRQDLKKPPEEAR